MNDFTQRPIVSIAKSSDPYRIVFLGAMDTSVRPGNTRPSNRVLITYAGDVPKIQSDEDVIVLMNGEQLSARMYAVEIHNPMGCNVVEYVVVFH